MPTDQFVVATAVANSGVVYYMKKPDGGIIAEYNTITNAQVQAAQGNDDKKIMQELEPWSRSTNISCTCDADSDLAAFSWGSKVAIFHLYEGHLCYWVHEPFNPESSCTDQKRIKLPEPDSPDMHPRAGTHLTVTGDTTGKDIYLFYQGKSDDVYCRVLDILGWEEPLKLGAAGRGTDIAVAFWPAHNNMGVYFQDKNFALSSCFYNGQEWTKPGVLSTEPTALTSISATRWVEHGLTELRLYFQIGESEIKEKSWTSGKGWWGEEVILDAFPAQFHVFVFTRGKAYDPVRTVWIVSQDGRVLVQKAYNSGDGWMGPVYAGLPRTC